MLRGDGWGPWFVVSVVGARGGCGGVFGFPGCLVVCDMESLVRVFDWCDDCCDVRVLR